eukprot:gene13204-19039_t
MERSYITAGFFRHTMYTRSNKIKQQQMLIEAQQAGHLQPQQHQQQSGSNPAGSPGGPEASGQSKQKNFFPAFGGAKDKEEKTSHSPGRAMEERTAHSPAMTTSASPKPKDAPKDDNDSGDEAPPAGSSGFGVARVSGSNDCVAAYFEKYVSNGFGVAGVSDPNDFVAAYFEKYVSDGSGFSYLPGFGVASVSDPNDFVAACFEKYVSDGSGFGVASVSDPNDFVAAYFEKYVSDGSGFSSLPGNWRPTVCADRSTLMIALLRTLTRRASPGPLSPDDVPKANGLRGQVNVADCIVEDVDEKGIARPPGTQPHPGERQYLIRLRHKDPRGFAVKDHNAVILRSETIQQKMEWLGRLSGASSQRPKPKPAPAKAERRVISEAQAKGSTSQDWCW